MKLYKLCLSIVAIMLLASCSNADASHKTESPVNQIQDVENITTAEESDGSSHQESIREFLIALNHYFYEQDLAGFQSHVDHYGLYSISVFDDGRDPNRAVLVLREDIREDFVLVSSQSGKAGITLSAGVFSTEVNEVYFHDSVFEDNSLQHIDWRVKDERVIQTQLPEILKGCQELILLNNEFVPQIFRLTDNLYAFSYSDMDDEDHSKFYGYWIIIEEIDESYIIRAIIELQ